MKFSHEQPSDLHPLRAYLYDKFDWRYRGKSVPPPGLHLLSATRMITSRSGLWQCDGHIKGAGFNDMPFDIHEVYARVVDDPVVTTEEPLLGYTGFRGLLVASNHKTSFLSRTIVRHDRGVLNTKIVDGMKRVGLVDQAFENRFEVYSDDQVESRALLSPDFMERLLRMDAHHRYAGMQVAFIAGRIYVVLPVCDTISFGCDAVCISPEQAAAKVIGEMETVFEILSDIDVLQASAGRKPESQIEDERKAWYAARVSEVEICVETALKDGVLSGAPIPDWMTADAYDLIDRRLHGMLRPRF